MAYGLNCRLCNYTIFSGSLYKLLKKLLDHFSSHIKTHKAFTVVCGNNKLQKEIENFYKKYELSGKLFKKLKVKRAPYVPFISELYHKQNKHVIYTLIKVDDFDYLLMKHSKDKPHNLVIL